MSSRQRFGGAKKTTTTLGSPSTGGSGVVAGENQESGGSPLDLALRMEGGVAHIGGSSTSLNTLASVSTPRGELRRPPAPHNSSNSNNQNISMLSSTGGGIGTTTTGALPRVGAAGSNTPTRSIVGSTTRASPGSGGKSRGSPGRPSPPVHGRPSSSKRTVPAGGALTPLAEVDLTSFRVTSPTTDHLQVQVEDQELPPPPAGAVLAHTRKQTRNTAGANEVDLSSFRVTSPTVDHLQVEEEDMPQLAPEVRALSPNGTRAGSNNKKTNNNNPVSRSPGSVGQRATSPLNPSFSSDSLDQLAEMRCPICIEPFQAPVTLPCSHHVCFSHIGDMKLFTEQGGKKDEEGFTIQCPKCRETAYFKSMEAVPINREMEGLVSMMVKLLQHTAELQQKAATSSRGGRAQQQQQGEGDSEGGGGDSRGDSPAMDGGQQPRSQSEEKRKKKKGVRFAQQDDVVEITPSSNGVNGAPPAPALKGVEQQQPPHQQRQKQQQERVRLEELEKELEAQRKALREEKEKQQKQRTAEWKKRIQQEQQERFAQENEASDSESFAYQSPQFRRGAGEETGGTGVDGAFTEEDYKRKEIEFHELRRVRDEQRERDRELREKQLRSDISSWVSSAPNAQTKSEEVTKQLQSLQDFITDMDNPNSPANLLKKQNLLKGASPSARPSTTGEVSDLEIEAALLQVERRVLREHEDEISNAQKAALAEERAKGYIEAYKRQALSGSKKPPPKPSFVPKLNRLKQLPPSM